MTSHVHDGLVRVLFAFAGGSGHAHPLVPLANAAAAAGHTVAFQGRSAATAELRQLGFVAFSDAVQGEDELPSIAPLLEVSSDREDRVLRESFAGRIARERAATVLALSEDWSPDVIVCDELDFGSMVAAERLGIPHATVLVIAAGSFVRADVVADPLNALRADYGLPRDPHLEMVRRDLVLSPCPPSFRDPAFPLPNTAHSIMPEPLQANENDAPPHWLSELNGTPTVYFTLGTVFNVESGDLFERVLSGLRELPVEVIATIGHQLDPAIFGPQTANIHIERYIPQSVVLPHCALVVSHGGSGSVIGALAAGKPSVVLPLGADQPLNAARCEVLGVGRAVDALGATPDAIGEAVLTVLEEQSYHAASERIRLEISALPQASHSMPLLERLIDPGPGA